MMREPIVKDWKDEAQRMLEYEGWGDDENSFDARKPVTEQDEYSTDSERQWIDDMLSVGTGRTLNERRKIELGPIEKEVSMDPIESYFLEQDPKTGAKKLPNEIPQWIIAGRQTGHFIESDSDQECEKRSDTSAIVESSEIVLEKELKSELNRKILESSIESYSCMDKNKIETSENEWVPVVRRRKHDSRKSGDSTAYSENLKLD